MSFFSYLKNLVLKCFRCKTSEIRNYLFWPENPTYTSVYLWKAFFHSFCEQSSDQDIFSLLFQFHLLLSVDAQYQNVNI